MSTLYGVGVEERLPVLVSGLNGVKLLGVPVVKFVKGEKAGPKIAQATYDLLDQWQCKDNVKCMVFDTTSVNTGAISAGCISLQTSLNKKLLWLACRHHIGERVLLHAWNSLEIEDSRSPNSSLFKNFQNKFTSFEHTKINKLYFPVIPPCLKEKRAVIENLCKEFLNVKQIRGDYRELAILTLVYLKKIPASFKRFQRPGAHNHTRWMAKLLYSIKIVLLTTQIKKLPEGSIFTNKSATNQLQKLTSFVQFVIFNYIPWWITAADPSSAPCNDLRLIKSLQMYKNVDNNIAEAASKAFMRHLWYLTQELAPLCLFSSSFNDSTKEEIRVKLLREQNESPDVTCVRHGTGFGKPTFPNISGEKEFIMSNFIGSESWNFFAILGIDTAFLSSPVSDWVSLESYQNANHNILSLHVVNDAAERGVKLCHDFLQCSTNETKLENILQVVENSRSTVPNLRKSETYGNDGAKNWFLKLS